MSPKLPVAFPPAGDQDTEIKEEWAWECPSGGEQATRGKVYRPYHDPRPEGLRTAGPRASPFWLWNWGPDASPVPGGCTRPGNQPDVAQVEPTELACP